MKDQPPAILPFPLKGLSVNTALDAQPPLTTPSAVNVRAYDPASGRDRGGQRSGLSKYMPQVAVGAGVPIQDLDVVTTNQPASELYAGIMAHPSDGGDTGLKVDYWPGSQYGITADLATGYGLCYGLIWGTDGSLYAVLNNDAIVPP